MLPGFPITKEIISGTGFFRFAVRLREAFFMTYFLRGAELTRFFAGRLYVFFLAEFLRFALSAARCRAVPKYLICFAERFFRFFVLRAIFLPFLAGLATRVSTTE